VDEGVVRPDGLGWSSVTRALEDIQIPVKDQNHNLRQT
jgi:hypothetical protein